MTTAQCHALVFSGIEKIEYKTIPMPCIEQPNDAILKVTVCGLCGSDLHPFHGRESCAFGTAFGHEVVGEVIALGSEVKSISIGKK